MGIFVMKYTFMFLKVYSTLIIKLVIYPFKMLCLRFMTNLKHLESDLWSSLPFIVVLSSIDSF